MDNAVKKVEYEIMGRKFIQEELSPEQMQRIMVSEAWPILSGAEPGMLEVYLPPDAVHEMFNILLYDEHDATDNFKRADFAREIKLSTVEAVLRDFFLFNPEFSSRLIGWTGLLQALAAGADWVERPGQESNSGSMSATEPAAATLPN